MALKVEGVHFGLADLDAGGVGVGIDLALHLETGVRGGGGDQLDDGLAPTSARGATASTTRP